MADISQNRELTGSDLLHQGTGYDSPAMRRAPPFPGADGGMFGEIQGKQQTTPRVDFGHLSNVALSEQRDNTRVIAPGESARQLQVLINGMQPMDTQQAFAIDPQGTPFGGGDQMAGLDAEVELALEPGEMMSESELLAYLELEERNAIDFIGSTIAQQRADALDYYFGQPFGNEEAGRSEVVSRDVLDTIEGMRPSILKPFVSTDDVCQFPPDNAHDAQAARQESAYVNYVLTRKNDGFGILNKWIWDGLVQKNGIVHYYWDDAEGSPIERYEGITDIQLALIQMQREVEIVQQRSYPDPAHAPGGVAPQMTMAGLPGQAPMAAPMLHDVVLRPVDCGCAKVENVPPEEWLVSRDAVDVNPKKARFCGRRRYMSVSSLRQMLAPRGIEVDDHIADYDAGHLQGTPEFIARRTDDPMLTIAGVNSDPASRMVMVRDLYPLFDFDGDGIAERRRILVVGRTVFINEEVEEPPFSAWTPYVIPHRFFGLCPADLAMDTQLIKSTLERQMLDNVYTINNNRTLVAEGAVDYDDMLSNAIGGIVRVDTKGQPIGNFAMAMPIQPIGAVVQPLLEYLDVRNHNRNGWSPQNFGSDPNAIDKSKTATEVQQISDNSRERTEMISRTFAEIGLKDLLVSLHGLLRRHATSADTFEFMGSWIDVDPRTWKTRRHMNVSVGLGTGNTQQKIANYMQIGQIQQQLASLGLVGPQEAYNVAVKAIQAMGEKDASQFIKAPQPGQQPPPPSNPAIDVQKAANDGLVSIEQIKQNGTLAKAQADNQGESDRALMKFVFDALLQTDANNQDQRMLILRNAHDMRQMFGAKLSDAYLASYSAAAQASAQPPNVLAMRGAR